MLSLHQISYIHPDKEALWEDLSLTLHKHDKIALVGNNGSGKSTLLRILAGKLQPSAGQYLYDTLPYYVPQHFGQYDQDTLADALQVAGKLAALHQILAGEVTEDNLERLADDWSIEERCAEALASWGLSSADLRLPMRSLSGGQKTRAFLAGIGIHRPAVVLLDEPSNHLDAEGRKLLYRYVTEATETLLVVSHDRSLLELLPKIYELDHSGITVYGGDYNFYTAQKALELDVLHENVKEQEKALRKARDTERASLERQQKLDARGKKKQEKAGLPTISMNTLRNNAENSTAKMKEVHAGKKEAIARELEEARKALPDRDKIRVGFGNPDLPAGKVLFRARQVNHRYGSHWLWPEPLDLELRSGERLGLAGNNGAGKTTLIRMLLGLLQPAAGSLEPVAGKTLYIDQDYSLLDNRLSVYGQAQQWNTGQLPEHEVKSRLTHFLFMQEDWRKACALLSGGERMRLLLCCLTLDAEAPVLIVLDEPTNNLDLSNIAILTDAVRSYNGALVVVSHDTHFKSEIGVGREYLLERGYNKG